MTEPLYVQLPQAIQTRLAETSTPGASAAVLVDGQPVFISAVGYRDAAHTIPLNPDAQFYIYSATKSLIAAAVMRLVEHGRIRLDAPVQEYLPSLGLDMPVTVRQLLNHTGGIPDYGGLRAYFDALKEHPTAAWSGEEFLSATLERGLAYTPGHGWAYSNIGYLLLRKTVEVVMGEPLRDALREQIFAPLDLRRTFVVETLEDAAQLTPGWSEFFTGDQQDIRAVYHPGWVSHGVAASTALELARVFDAALGGDLLTPESRAAMLEAVPVNVNHPFFRQPAYGLGLMVDLGSAYGVIAGHGGGGAGLFGGGNPYPRCKRAAHFRRGAGEPGRRRGWPAAGTRAGSDGGWPGLSFLSAYPGRLYALRPRSAVQSPRRWQLIPQGPANLSMTAG